MQNGSDVRGIALEGVEGEAVNLTPFSSFYIARGFVKWLAKKSGTPVEELRVGIGRDPRLSGPVLLAAAQAGIAAAGAAEVADCGLSSTPAMFMGTVLPSFKFHGRVALACGRRAPRLSSSVSSG